MAQSFYNPMSMPVKPLVFVDTSIQIAPDCAKLTLRQLVEIFLTT